MSWRELLNREMESNYSAADKLFDLVKDDELDFKPVTGSNWLSMGQLLLHISNACGSNIKGFVTGDWGMPDGVDLEEMSPEEMLPPAEKFPTVTTVAEAKSLLAEDKKLSQELLDKCTDEDLRLKPAPAPWDPRQVILGHRILEMVDHLRQHKSQLYYYLKLQGKPVNTMHLYGM
jgi:hypothetical protein